MAVTEDLCGDLPVRCGWDLDENSLGGAEVIGAWEEVAGDGLEVAVREEAPGVEGVGVDGDAEEVRGAGEGGHLAGIGGSGGAEGAGFGEEGLGVEGSGGLVLVFEVGVDIAVAGEGGEAGGEGCELGCGVAAIAAEAEAGVGGGGVDLGAGEIVAFGDAEGGVVVSEEGVGGFGEPGLVAELEGDGRGLRGEGGGTEEFGEAVGVGLEVGRKLEEEEAELAGLADGLEG